MYRVRHMVATLLDFFLPQSRLDRAILSITPEELSKHLAPREEGGITALFRYRNLLIRRLIALLKYKGRIRLAEVCASVACDYLIEEWSDRMLFSAGEKPLVLPIPLSPKRERERGFNQAALIAHALHTHATFFDEAAGGTLIKIRETAPQTTLPRAERLVNVRGAFAVAHPERVAGRDIILIDDVATTGATLHEARSTLLESGARSVFMLALAH